MALDPTMLDAARGGDPDAVGAIWRELSPALAGYLAVRGAADAEGLTSDVFIALLPRIPMVTGGVTGLRTLAFSIAHARLVDETRRRHRRPAVVEFDLQRHDGVTTSAEDDALERQSDGAVADLLASLKADHREVLALRVIADLSLEQTAEVMGRSVGSVKQLQRRALTCLRGHLEQRGAPAARRLSLVMTEAR